MGADVAVAPPEQAPLPVRAALFVAGCGSVLSLLAWVYGLGSFAVWSFAVGAPLVALTVAVPLLLDRSGRWPATRAAIRAGALGGLLGTVGYDLFRVPFVYGLGLGLLAPIDSYGVLLLGADSSSAWTGVAGWSYHTMNGVGFAIAYAVLFRGRHWGFGLAWAMVLESATVVSPFATTYALRGAGGVQWLPIALAYAAHVPYGVAIGKAAQHADLLSEQARAVTRAPVLVASGASLALLLVWQHPFSPDARVQQGARVAEGASAVIERGRLYPQWLRVAPGQCATARNLDDLTHEIGGTVVPARGTVRLCNRAEGVHRLKVDGQPFSGGYLLVDAHA